MNRPSRGFTLLSFFFVAALDCQALAKEKLNEKQALDMLVKKIQEDKLYDSWTTMACLSFVTEEDEDADYVDFAIRERHVEGCPGDPETAPIVDRFRVSRTKKIIQWYSAMEDQWLPYESVLKSRLSEKG